MAATVLRNDGSSAHARRIARKLRGGRRYRPPSTPAYRLESCITPLVVPTCAPPDVSIVIPAFGQPLLTVSCLARIARLSTGDYEVIDVDNASPQRLADALAEVQ